MALIVTLVLGALLAGLGSALTMATVTEMAIAGTHRDGIALTYAAEAAAELALLKLESSDWAVLLDAPPEPYIAGDLAALTGTSSSVSPHVEVWLRDVTGSAGAAAAGSRVAEIQATALGTGGAKRTVTLVARLIPSGENVRIDRLSWTS